MLHCYIAIEAHIEKIGRKMTNPIRPEEVVQLIKAAHIPPVVIEVFNKQIREMFKDDQAEVFVIEVINELGERDFDTRKLLSRHWFGIVDLFRNAGWVVEYDWPSHNEPYPARYVFKLSAK